VENKNEIKAKEAAQVLVMQLCKCIKLRATRIHVNIQLPFVRTEINCSTSLPIAYPNFSVIFLSLLSPVRTSDFFCLLGFPSLSFLHALKLKRLVEVVIDG
jgi:hypothetical protein